MSLIVGAALHLCLTLVLVASTDLGGLASFIIAGVVVWLGILVITEDLLG